MDPSPSSPTPRPASRRPWTFRLLGGLALVGLSCGVAFYGCRDEGGLGNPGNVATSGTALTAPEVERILVRAVSYANSQNQSAAIAVLDREGEVLGVYLMNPRDTNGDGIIDTPGAANVATAIAKAATACAFQSEGEAFTTRTAFFIVQGNYPPGAANTAGGPLFGVQDSGLASGDSHILAWDKDGNAVGSGISGELGGIPIYKANSPVGGIGVDTVSPVQTLTGPGSGAAATLVVPVQVDIDEAIARAGVANEFNTPPVIQATNVFVDGQQFPFYDDGGSAPQPFTTIAPTLSAFPANIGAMVAQFPVRASPLAAEVRTGSEYGIRPTHRFLGRVGARSAAGFVGSLSTIDRPAGAFLSSATLTLQNVPIQNLPTRSVAGGIGEDRAPAIDSIEPPPAEGGLTAAEVNAIVANAVGDARRSIAGIRLPRGSHVTVHVAVVDVRGNLLALYRMADGTLFSSDIAVQKARTCAFFSSDSTQGLPTVAFSARAIGFMAQPYFPPGIRNGIGAGPLVYFRDLINRGKRIVEVPPSNRLITPPPRLPSDGTTDEDPLTGGNQFFNDFGGSAPAELSAVRSLISSNGGINLLADRTDTSPNFISPGLQSGLMTFPGGVPLYRGTRLIGAVGVSGDGVDEDDSASFAGSAGYYPPRGTRCDEVSDQAIATVLTAKINTIVSAILAHPDLRIRNVYGPIIQAERSRFQQMISRGFDNTRIPYVKLPRNPQKF